MAYIGYNTTGQTFRTELQNLLNKYLQKGLEPNTVKTTMELFVLLLDNQVNAKIKEEAEAYMKQKVAENKAKENIEKIPEEDVEVVE